MAEVSTIIKQCSNCSQATDNMKRCGKCKTTFYCSKECQNVDWGKHKSFCIVPTSWSEYNKLKEEGKVTKEKLELVHMPKRNVNEVVNFAYTKYTDICIAYNTWLQIRPPTDRDDNELHRRFVQIDDKSNHILLVPLDKLKYDTDKKAALTKDIKGFIPIYITYKTLEYFIVLENVASRLK